jgi:aquaporin NIP
MTGGFMGLKGMKEQYLAEALGAFIIVFASIGAPVVNILADNQLGLVGMSLAAGLAVLAVCYSVGHISGGHANPAITIAFATQKKFPVRHVLPYVASQCAGAVAACLAIYMLFGNITNFGLIAPVYSWQLVFLAEFAISFLLMFVIMGVATDPRAENQSTGGLPIGLTAVLGTMFAIGISGAMMNPARALAPAILLMDFSWQGIYWGATLLGAIFGAWAYERVRNETAQKAEMFGVLGPIR